VTNSKGLDIWVPQKGIIFCTNLLLPQFFVAIYKELNKTCTKQTPGSGNTGSTNSQTALHPEMLQSTCTS